MSTDTVYVCNCMCHYPRGWRWEASQPRPQPRVFVPCEECDVVKHGPWDERPGLEAYITKAVDSPPMVIDTLQWCFLQNYHLDKSNACVHCAPVRFSPITFRLHKALVMLWPEGEGETREMAEVAEHTGAYEEDKGR